MQYDNANSFTSMNSSLWEGERLSFFFANLKYNLTHTKKPTINSNMKPNNDPNALFTNPSKEIKHATIF
jgi:hypothetical protein